MENILTENNLMHVTCYMKLPLAFGTSQQTNDT